MEHYPTLSLSGSTGSSPEYPATELLITSDDLKGSVEKLSAAASSYQKLLNRAMRSASRADAAALPRLGMGLSALTKALSAVEKLQE